jgi:hypothetical protein
MLKRKVILPRNYASLTRAEQTFVVINLERVDRGIRPIVGMTARLNRQAKAGAVAAADPNPLISVLRQLGVRRYRTLWAQDYGALASDYEWMYDDGYAGAMTANITCRYAGAPGCWGHRRAILMRFRTFPLLLGGTAAAHAVDGADSLAVVLTGGHGRAPHFTYTWRNALRHGADGHRTR